MTNWKIWNMKLQSFWKNSEYVYPPLNDIPPPALLIAAIRGPTEERINEPVSKFEPWKASLCARTYVQLNKSNLSHKPDLSQSNRLHKPYRCELSPEPNCHKYLTLTLTRNYFNMMRLTLHFYILNLIRNFVRRCQENIQSLGQFETKQSPLRSPFSSAESLKWSCYDWDLSSATWTVLFDFWWNSSSFMLTT